MFWTRWTKEYLPSLTQRSKWQQDSPNLSVGDLVLVQEKDLKRSQWPMARVIDVFIGKDDIVRSASIKRADGSILVRPTKSLCILEKNQ